DVRFAEKWLIGLKLIRASRDVPHGWIVADDEYGRVGEFRARLRKWKERYVLDVPCNTLVRVEEPASAAKSSRSRSAPAARARPRKPASLRVDEWAAVHPAARRWTIERRPGEMSPLIV